MRILSTAWILDSLAEFEAYSALPVHAQLGYGSGRTHLDIYVLDGFVKLDRQIIDAYLEKGIRFHDATAVAKHYVAKFGALMGQIGASQGSLYELYCYVRWLVVRDIVGDERFVHIDLDIFFQDSLDTIETLFDGATGTFGSPCLTAVSDISWLSSYECALDQLLGDRAGLQAQLGYDGNEFRADISSDQDLVHALQTRALLPCKGLDGICAERAVFINPIWPYLNKPAKPQEFSVVNGKDTIGGKPVLFWHLQNNFSDYLSRFAILLSYRRTWMADLLPCRLDFPFLQLRPNAENFAFQALRDSAWPRVLAHISAGGNVNDLGSEKFFSRTWIAEWFILQGQGRELFSSGYWWQDGVFP
jgi:hypothetical protein